MESIPKQNEVEELNEDRKEEAAETPEQETAEEHTEVPLSEEFQLQATELVNNSTKMELSFIRDLANQRDEELRKSAEGSDEDLMEQYNTVKG